MWKKSKIEKLFLSLLKGSKWDYGYDSQIIQGRTRWTETADGCLWILHYQLTWCVNSGGKSLCILHRTPIEILSATWVSWRYVGATLHTIPLNILNPSSYWIMRMYDQSNLMGGRKPSYLTADFSIRTLSATCVGSVPVVWTKRRSYRRSCRRLNGGTTAVRKPTERCYNAGTMLVQRWPDCASSILKPYFVRTYVSYVGPHTGSCSAHNHTILTLKSASINHAIEGLYQTLHNVMDKITKE